MTNTQNQEDVDRILVEFENDRDFLNEKDFFLKYSDNKTLALAFTRNDYSKEMIHFRKLGKMLTDAKNLTVEANYSGKSYAIVKEKSIHLDIVDYEILRYNNPEAATALLKGLNLHELAHIEHTIMSSTQFNNEAFRMVHNILEDGRIETIYAQRYPKGAHYFTYSLNYKILLWLGVTDKKKTWKDWLVTYALLYGRRSYFNDEQITVLAKVRKATERMLIFDKKDISKISQTERIIQEYLVQSDDSKQVLKLTKEFSEVLEAEETTDKKGGSGKTLTLKISKNIPGTSGRSVNGGRKGLRDYEKKAIKNALNALSSIDKKLFDALQNQNSSSSPGGNGVSVQKKTKAEIQEEVKLIEQDLQKELEKNGEDVLEKVQDEIANDIRQMEGLTSSIDFLKKELKDVAPYLPNHKEISDKDKLANLVKLYQLSLQGHYTSAYHGTANMQKVMNYEKTGDLKLFERYLVDKTSDCKMAVVINLDSSGSMNGFANGPARLNFQNEAPDCYYNLARSCAWKFASALEETGSLVMVQEFSDKSFIMKPFLAETSYWKRRQCNGTEIGGVMQHSVDCLKAIKENYPEIKKYLIINVTDGEYMNSNYDKIKGDPFTRAKEEDFESIWIHVDGDLNNFSPKSSRLKDHTKYIRLDKFDKLYFEFEKILIHFYQTLLEKYR